MDEQGIDKQNGHWKYPWVEKSGIEELSDLSPLLLLPLSPPIFTSVPLGESAKLRRCPICSICRASWQIETRDCVPCFLSTSLDNTVCFRIINKSIYALLQLSWFARKLIILIIACDRQRKMSRQRGSNISCHMGGEEQDVVSDDKDNGRPCRPIFGWHLSSSQL